jgi:hypothetical protein
MSHCNLIVFGGYAVLPFLLASVGECCRGHWRRAHRYLWFERSDRFRRARIVFACKRGSDNLFGPFAAMGSGGKGGRAGGRGKAGGKGKGGKGRARRLPQTAAKAGDKRDRSGDDGGAVKHTHHEKWVGPPREVHVTFKAWGLSGISNVEQRYNSDFSLTMRWIDPTLVRSVLSLAAAGSLLLMLWSAHRWAKRSPIWRKSGTRS